MAASHSSDQYAPLPIRVDPESPGNPPQRQDRTDSFSLHSRAPLNPKPSDTYPPLPANYAGGENGGSDKLQRPSPAHAQSHTGSSWDLLSGIKKLEDDYEHFDARNASTSHLKFADGDLPRSKFVKIYNWLLNVSIVTRWTLFIVPVLGMLWIPGIIGLTAAPHSRLWSTKLIWWSIWLSVVWGGWWLALATSFTLPFLLKGTLGIVAIGSHTYIQWLRLLYRYVALFGWALTNWISFTPLIIHNRLAGTSEHSLTTIVQLLFGLFLCVVVLLAEKLIIQWVAHSFHERSYADRIAEQKQARRILVVLYSNSSNIPSRDDTLRDGPPQKGGSAINPHHLLKKALHGVKDIAQTTTTAFGNVASEIAGRYAGGLKFDLLYFDLAAYYSSVLQPNSPAAMVATALTSANKSRLLARRLFYSFRAAGSNVVVLNDIAMLFSNAEEAAAAFALFDKDGNGDATRDEFETTCLECHREQLSIASSLRDIDSAVGRLDNILMSLYLIIAVLILAVTLETQFQTFVTAAGTLVLGLSWLIGGSLQEVLTSIIFTFVKHPYDVGDRIQIDKDTFTVKEIRLLSTIFLDGSNSVVQAPNVVLNTKYICNLRRSPQMSESFTWDVAYGTSFDDIEALRAKMLAFVKSESRDFLPSFDVVVVDFPDQQKLTLKSDIMYKSNWQQGALKSKRRNKWICALKMSLKELKMYGSGGDPDAKSPPKAITVVPYEPAEHDNSSTPPENNGSAGDKGLPQGSWKLQDPNAVLLDPTQDVYGEVSELYLTNPRPKPAGPARPLQNIKKEDRHADNQQIEAASPFRNASAPAASTSDK